MHGFFLHVLMWIDWINALWRSRSTCNREYYNNKKIGQNIDISYHLPTPKYPYVVKQPPKMEFHHDSNVTAVNVPPSQSREPEGQYDSVPICFRLVADDSSYPEHERATIRKHVMCSTPKQSYYDRPRNSDWWTTRWKWALMYNAWSWLSNWALCYTTIFHDNKFNIIQIFRKTANVGRKDIYGMKC